MKILAIGNSFSQDATRYLSAISQSAGEELFVRNIYIGGCSLERHAQNVRSGEAAYAYEKDAQKLEMMSVTEALQREKWDFVTVQQVSGLSGVTESYEPFMGQLIECIKKLAPQARIVFHRTWPYEKGSKHGAFPTYGCDRSVMYRRIVEATEVAAGRYSLPIIGAGDAIYRAVCLNAFDPEHAGAPIYRDGFHLSLTYGRYLAALVWFNFFTGRSAFDVSYAPPETDARLITLLKSVV